MGSEHAVMVGIGIFCVIVTILIVVAIIVGCVASATGGDDGK